jgi:hypothetical protein
MVRFAIAFRTSGISDIFLSPLSFSGISEYYQLNINERSKRKGGTMSIRSKIGITIILSLGIVVLIGWTSVINQRPQPSWKGTIVTENGVKVVKNPAEPFYGELVLQLEENLSLGGNVNDDNYYFPGGASIAIDQQGNLFIRDAGNIRIQEYDKAGKYVQTIGRKGQGPGEFQFPAMVDVDRDGNIWVLDAPTRALKVFSPDGTFKKSTPLRASIQPQFYVSKEGYIFGMEINYRTPGGPRIAVLKLNPDGSFAETIAQFQGELKPNQKGYAIHSYSNSLFLCGLNPNALCYGFSMDYKIFLADGQGKTISIIQKAEKPISVSGEEKDWIKKKGIFAALGVSKKEREEVVVFPPHRPYFGRIVADDTGRIYVSRTPSVLGENKIKVFDVYSVDGIYLYRTQLPFWPEVIKGGFIYEIRTNKETGDIRIVRHKVTNWDQIKSGI